MVEETQFLINKPRLRVELKDISSGGWLFLKMTNEQNPEDCDAKEADCSTSAW